MIAITLAAVLTQESPWPQPVDPISDAEFCSMLHRVADDLPPWMIDAATRLDGVTVSCSEKTISYQWSILASVNEAWREEMQQRWNDFVCNKDAFGSMARRGWRFTQNVTFEGGKRIAQNANC